MQSYKKNMKCLQNKDGNSHIFRFYREYGVFQRSNTVNLPLCHRYEKADLPF